MFPQNRTRPVTGTRTTTGRRLRRPAGVVAGTALLGGLLVGGFALPAHADDHLVCTDNDTGAVVDIPADPENTPGITCEPADSNPPYGQDPDPDPGYGDDPYGQDPGDDPYGGDPYGGDPGDPNGDNPFNDDPGPADPANNTAGNNQQVTEPVVEGATEEPPADPAVSPAQTGTPDEVQPAMLPRTGAGPVTTEAAVALGLIGAGLAAMAAARRRPATRA